MSYFLIDQSNIDFKVKADALGPNDLLFQSFESIETLSTPYEFKFTFQSQRSDLPVDTLIGTGVTFEIVLDDGPRYFHGIFGRFEQGITSRGIDEDEVNYYHALVYPTWWKLQFGTDCRIFQHQSALDIIKVILGENGVAFQDKTQGAGTAVRAYCVQYNESHFNFVSRLMEAEGIFYYFSHSDGSHTMVLADDAGAHEKCPNVSTAEMVYETEGTIPFHLVLDAHYQAQLVTSDFQHVDYDYKKPSTKLLSAIPGGGSATFGQIYEYPGDFLVSGQGDGLANIHLQESEALKLMLTGVSTAMFFTPGYIYSLKKHARDDLNQDYILHTVKHRLRLQPGVNGGELSYQNEFASFPSSVTFRPPRISMRPRIHSTQTAIVTGKGGEEIWTDQYGRIKVLFHWDQRNSQDETSSCWIRVAQGWAANGWGILFTPRIGMEVVVTFICGDPDRPLVTGVVYNADNMPPYLPDQPTKSTILSNTTLGGGGFNEIRFEDKAGSEEIWVHAQKDMNIDVIHDRTAIIETGDDLLDIQMGNRTTHIKHNYTKTLDDGDETILIIRGDRHITLKKGDEDHTLKKGDRTLLLKKGNESRTLLKGDRSITIVKGNETHLIKKGDEDRLIKKGNRSVTINKGNESWLIKKGNEDRLIKKGDRTHTINKGNETMLIKKGNRSITINKGNETWKIKKGNESRKIVKGNRSLKIVKGNEKKVISKGNLSVKLGSGNETNKIVGKYKRKVTGNYTLEIGGNLTIKVKGKILIKTSKGYQLKAALSIKTKSGLSTTHKAGTSFTQKAGTSFTQKAGLSFKQKAGLSFTQKAGLSFTQKAGTSFTSKAGVSFTQKAGVSFTQKAGVSFTTKGGVSVTVKAGMNLTLKGGMMAQMKGGMMAQVKGGLMAQVKGGAIGMAKAGGIQIVKGGLVKIN